MTEYFNTINNIASIIFLNYYNATQHDLILSEDCTDDLIIGISDNFNIELPIVEIDISNSISDIISKIPEHMLQYNTVH